jgi:hypothetical protein
MEIEQWCISVRDIPPELGKQFKAECPTRIVHVPRARAQAAGWSTLFATPVPTRHSREPEVQSDLGRFASHHEEPEQPHDLTEPALDRWLEERDTAKIPMTRRRAQSIVELLGGRPGTRAFDQDVSDLVEGSW